MTARSIVIVGLMSLGVIEVLYGLWFGPDLVYSHDSPYWKAMHSTVPSAAQIQLYLHYPHEFKAQWMIVAWFGVGTIAAATMLLMIDGKKPN